MKTLHDLKLKELEIETNKPPRTEEQQAKKEKEVEKVRAWMKKHDWRNKCIN